MLAAAAPTAHPTGLAENLEIQPLNFTAIREEMTVAAVVAEDDVARAVDRRDHADCHRLLTEAGVGRPGQHSGGKQIQQRLLEQSNRVQQAVAFSGRRVSPARIDRDGDGRDRAGNHDGGASNSLTTAARKVAA